MTTFEDKFNKTEPMFNFYKNKLNDYNVVISGGGAIKLNLMYPINDYSSIAKEIEILDDTVKNTSDIDSLVFIKNKANKSDEILFGEFVNKILNITLEYNKLNSIQNGTVKPFIHIYIPTVLPLNKLDINHGVSNSKVTYTTTSKNSKNGWSSTNKTLLKIKQGIKGDGLSKSKVAIKRLITSTIIPNLLGVVTLTLKSPIKSPIGDQLLDIDFSLKTSPISDIKYITLNNGLNVYSLDYSMKILLELMELYNKNDPIIRNRRNKKYNSNKSRYNALKKVINSNLFKNTYKELKQSIKQHEDFLKINNIL